MPVIIANPEQAAQGIRDFNHTLAGSPELQARLPYARAWYVLTAEGSKPLFGPSKYIGYRNMDADLYLEGNGLDGRETERILANWYEVIDDDHPMYAKLFDELTIFLGRYGKSPSRAVRLNVPRQIAGQAVNENADQEDIALADLIITVARRLPSHQRRRIREALS